MGDLAILPGVARPDLVDDLPADALLKNACGKGLIDVVIVGRGAGGEPQVWGTSPDVDRSIGLLTRGIAYLSAAPQSTSQSELDSSS